MEQSINKENIEEPATKLPCVEYLIRYIGYFNSRNIDWITNNDNVNIEASTIK